MTSRKPWIVALVCVLVLPSIAHAQIPSLPGVSGVDSSALESAGGAALPGAEGAASGLGSSALGGAATSAIPAAAPAAPQTTLGGFLGLSPTSLQNAGNTLSACKAKFCQSQFGQMLGSFSSGPLAGMTGGFLPSLCPPAPSAAALAAMQNQSGPLGAEAVAGKIKQSEADAKARVAAINYLATCDCNRWKEARIALINGLRADPNECVRWAAAQAFNTGCCCSKPVIEALRVCVAGEDTDGNPPETSERVKAAAFTALQNCLMRVPEDLPPESPAPARERDRGGPATNLELLPAPLREGSNTVPSHRVDPGHMTVAHRTMASRRTDRLEPQTPPKTFGETVDAARKTLFHVSQNPTPPSVLPQGKRSLLQAFFKARQDMANRRQAEADATSASDVRTADRPDE
jgi:hypothetical protein